MRKVNLFEIATRALVGVCAIGTTILAQQLAIFPTNPIGRNPFVSDRSGGVYLIFKNALYHALTDESDSWDRITDNVEQVVADRENDNIFYAITAQKRLAKSLDKGRTWITLSPLPGSPHPSPWCFYVNPANPQELFVGTSAGLIKSTDAGFSWHQAALAGTVFQITINPHSPKFQCAITTDGLFASADGGTNWTKSENGLPTEVVRGQGRTATMTPVKLSALVPVDGDKFFLLALTQGKGVFRSDDNGASWQSSSIGLPATETFSKGFAARDRIVIASQSSICASTDGTHWQTVPIKSTYGQLILSGFMKHPKHNGFLLYFNFATDDVTKVSRLGYVDPSGTLIGLNYGVVPHSEVDNIWVSAQSGEPTIFAFTADLNFSDQAQQWTRPVFLAVSRDLGYSWAILDNMSRCGENAFVRKDHPADFFIFGRAGCILRTDDGGSRLEMLPGVTGGAANGEVTKIEPDPADRNILYYSVGVNEREVFRYQYDPSTKQGQSVDLKVMGADVIVAEDNNKLLFTATGHLSTDGGWTWTDKSAPLVKFLPNIRSGYRPTLRLLSFHGTELRILLWTFDNMSRNANIVVLRSGDLGSTWQTIASFPKHKLVRVFRDPHDSANILFSAVLFNKGQFVDAPAMAKVLESKNGGETWNEIYSVTPPTPELKSSANYLGDVTAKRVLAVAQVPLARGRALLVGGSNGLWKSDDEGKSWKRLGGVQ